MILVSQDRERVLWFGRAFNALEYSEQTEKKGKQEKVRHTICISDGCLEEVAEYESKERCLQVLKDFCGAYESECYTVEFSTLQRRQQDQERTERTLCMSFLQSRRCKKCWYCQLRKSGLI